MDTATAKHLASWIDRQVRPEAQEAVLSAMLVEFENDADFWGNQGWTVLFHQVGGREIEMREESLGSGYFELLDGIA